MQILRCTAAAVLTLLATSNPVSQASDEASVEWQVVDAFSDHDVTVYSAGSQLRVQVFGNRTAATISLPRFCNVVEEIAWERPNPKVDPPTVKPEIKHWVFRRSKSSKQWQTFVMTLDGPLQLLTEDTHVRPEDDGVVRLKAQYATTYGEKLRYEPQPHKNTIGYWAVVEDYAEWKLQVPAAGRYEVVIHQGCGKGHGGSQAAVIVGEQKLSFEVQDTGHFQNFVPRKLGTIELSGGKPEVLAVKASKKPSVAVMDVRLIELIPVTK